MNNTPLVRRPGFWAVIIILAATMVRLWFIASAQLDLVQDEAQYWDWTRRLQLSYYSKGPLIAWIIALWTAVFGNTEFGVRFGAVLGSALIQVALYLFLARGAGRPKLGLFTLILANTAPLFMASSVLMTTDNPLMLCWALALAAMYWATRRPAARWTYILFGAAMALGVLAKYMMLAMWPTLLLFLWGLRRSGLLEPDATRRLIRAALIGTALGMLPILVWNWQNDWVGFRHVAGLTHVAGSAATAFIRPKYFFEYLGAQIGLVTPWWFVFMLLGACRALSRAWRNQGEASSRRLDWLLISAFWPVWLGFLLFSLHAKVYPNWSAVSYAGGLILASRAFMAYWGGAFGAHTRLRWLWPSLGALCFVVLILINHLPTPPNLDPSLRLKGWSDLGRELDKLEKSAFTNPDKVFYFADSYDMTAALAFYAPGQPLTYSADFGRRMSQYDLWPGPADKVGWDAIYVEKDFRDTPPTQLRPMFRDLELIKFQTSHRGRPGRKFTLVLCRDFTGQWPELQSKSY